MMMGKKGSGQIGCGTATRHAGKGGCCNIDAVLSIDERGQMVLPKGVRTRAGIRPGDKLALICLEDGGEVCCMALMKADRMESTMKEMLGPVFKGVLEG